PGFGRAARVRACHRHLRGRRRGFDCDLKRRADRRWSLRLEALQSSLRGGVVLVEAGGVAEPLPRGVQVPRLESMVAELTGNFGGFVARIAALGVGEPALEYVDGRTRGADDAA